MSSGALDSAVGQLSKETLDQEPGHRLTKAESAKQRGLRAELWRQHMTPVSRVTATAAVKDVVKRGQAGGATAERDPGAEHVHVRCAQCRRWPSVTLPGELGCHW